MIALPIFVIPALPIPRIMLVCAWISWGNDIDISTFYSLPPHPLRYSVCRSQALQGPQISDSECPPRFLLMVSNAELMLTNELSGIKT